MKNNEIEGLRQQNEWQPIETAPKDGTRVLVWRKHEAGYSQASRLGVDYYKNGSWWGSRRLMPPTHWMPLPQAPEGEQ